MKKVLIIQGGWDGHKPKETSDIVAAALSKSDCVCEIVSTLTVLTDAAKLASFDLIVPNWTMGQLEGPQEAGLVEAVASGVGLAGFHGGMGDAFRSSTGYQFLVGGQFVAHPDNEKDYVVNIVKKDDPIVKGLADFKMHTEQYYMHVDPHNEVLATTVFQTVSAPWINGCVMPVIWKRHHGKGRVFYSSLGHRLGDFEVPEMIQTLRRGMLWAAR